LRAMRLFGCLLHALTFAFLGCTSSSVHGLDPASKPPKVQEYLDRVHPQDRESMADLIKGISAKASPFDATKRIVRPHGEIRYIRCVSGPVVENQSLEKYVGSAIDATEQELS